MLIIEKSTLVNGLGKICWFAFFIVACHSPNRPDLVKFDPEIWKAEAGNDLAANNRRADMVRDLRENVIKVGMSRVEIHNLLGAPDIQKATRDTYALGKAAYSPDFEYFVIEYSDAMVARAFLQRG